MGSKKFQFPICASTKIHLFHISICFFPLVKKLNYSFTFKFRLQQNFSTNWPIPLASSITKGKIRFPSLSISIFDCFHFLIISFQFSIELFPPLHFLHFSMLTCDSQFSDFWPLFNWSPLLLEDYSRRDSRRFLTKIHSLKYSQEIEHCRSHSSRRWP